MKQTKRTELLFDCLSFCFHQCSAETAATSNIHLRDISILPSQSNSGSCLDEQHLCCRSRCRWRLVLFFFSLVCLSVFLSLNTTQLLNCWNQHIFCCCCWYFLIRRVYHFCRLSEKCWLVSKCVAAFVSISFPCRWISPFPGPCRAACWPTAQMSVFLSLIAVVLT